LRLWAGVTFAAVALVSVAVSICFIFCFVYWLFII